AREYVFVRASLVKKPSRLQGAVICLFFLESDIKRKNLPRDGRHMSAMRHRYNAEIQRAKGLLELAAALYDTSLSFQTTRAAEQVLQTESRVGYSIKLALAAAREKGVSLSFAADGFRELRSEERRVGKVC